MSFAEKGYILRRNEQDSAEELLSELLAVAIINHSMVRYYLNNHPLALVTILQIMQLKDVMAVKHYCQTLFENHQALFSDIEKQIQVQHEQEKIKHEETLKQLKKLTTIEKDQFDPESESRQDTNKLFQSTKKNHGNQKHQNKHPEALMY